VYIGTSCPTACACNGSGGRYIETLLQTQNLKEANAAASGRLAERARPLQGPCADRSCLLIQGGWAASATTPRSLPPLTGLLVERSVSFAASCGFESLGTLRLRCASVEEGREVYDGGTAWGLVM
jgi:hypothetical protein